MMQKTKEKLGPVKTEKKVSKTFLILGIVLGLIMLLHAFLSLKSLFSSSNKYFGFGSVPIDSQQGFDFETFETIFPEERARLDVQSQESLRVVTSSEELATTTIEIETTTSSVDGSAEEN